MARPDVKLLSAGFKRKRFGAVFSSAVRSPYNKRTMEADCGAFGPLGRMQINKLRVIKVME